MIVDVFLFNDEFDMLECRLYQLRDVVDRFIAIEGDMTLAGDAKPYRLADVQAEAGRYPRVEVIKASLVDLKDTPSQRQAWVAEGMEHRWKRDWKQRAACSNLVRDLPEDTTIMYGDVDEIPRTTAVMDFDGKKSRLMMQMLVYSTHWGTESDSWTGTVIGKKPDMKSFPHEHRARNNNPMISNAGWHLTWFGGMEACLRKSMMFAHGELDKPHQVARRYFDHVMPGDGERLLPYAGDLPAWVEDGHAPPVWTAR